jgi:hypothetical protein
VPEALDPRLKKLLCDSIVAYLANTIAPHSVRDLISLGPVNAYVARVRPICDRIGIPIPEPADYAVVAYLASVLSAMVLDGRLLDPELPVAIEADEEFIADVREIAGRLGIAMPGA